MASLSDWELNISTAPSGAASSGQSENSGLQRVELDSSARSFRVFAERLPRHFNGIPFDK